MDIKTYQKLFKLDRPSQFCRITFHSLHRNPVWNARWIFYFCIYSDFSMNFMEKDLCFWNGNCTSNSAWIFFIYFNVYDIFWTFSFILINSIQTLLWLFLMDLVWSVYFQLAEICCSRRFQWLYFFFFQFWSLLHIYWMGLGIE